MNARSLSLKYQTNKNDLKILTYGDVRMTTKKEAEENPFEEMAPLTYTDQKQTQHPKTRIRCRQKHITPGNKWGRSKYTKERARITEDKQ